MAWRLAKSLVTLRDQLNTAYPNRNKASDGTIGDAAHAGTVSQHNPNSAGVVTAFDITTDPQIHPIDLANALTKDPRTWYVILNRRIFVDGSWQTYTGVDPHTSHIHISTVQNPAGYDNPADWNIIKQEDQMVEFNSGDRININFAFYGKDLGLYGDAVGKEYKAAIEYIFGSDDYKQQSRVNSGDVINFNNFQAGLGDAISGKLWKDAAYEDFIKLPVGDFVKTDVYIKKKG